MLRAAELPSSHFGSLRYFLAPMAGITDCVFRRLMRQMGADVVVSELISAEGLIRGGKRTSALMQFNDDEHPIGIQLFGTKIPTLVEAAKLVEQAGADFVDINLGCPVKKIVTGGGGAAWLRNTVVLYELLSKIKNAVGIAVTIKIRTGWDEKSINAHEIVNIASDAGISWVAIHGRTRAQGYSGQADWGLIRQIACTSPIPIIGNGDVVTADDANRKISDGYAHGVMIGRGALKNPWIFHEIRNGPCKKHDFTKLIEKHFLLMQAGQGEQRAFLSLKKFFSWYSTGLPDASSFRARLFQTMDANELKNMASEYFSNVSQNPRTVPQEPFLMGGHG